MGSRTKTLDLSDADTTQALPDPSVRSKAANVRVAIRSGQKDLCTDIVIYALFLTTFVLSALIPFVQVAWDGYQMINIFTKYSSNLDWPDPASTFAEISSVADFWSWWNGPFHHILLDLDPYANEDCSGKDDVNSTCNANRTREDHQDGYILSNYVVGTVRLRQQRAACDDDMQESTNIMKAHPGRTLCYHATIWEDQHAEETRNFSWPEFSVSCEEFTDALSDALRLAPSGSDPVLDDEPDDEPDAEEPADEPAVELTEQPDPPDSAPPSEDTAPPPDGPAPDDAGESAAPPPDESTLLGGVAPGAASSFTSPGLSFDARRRLQAGAGDAGPGSRVSGEASELQNARRHRKLAATGAAGAGGTVRRLADVVGVEEPAATVNVTEMNCTLWNSQEARAEWQPFASEVGDGTCGSLNLRRHVYADMVHSKQRVSDCKSLEKRTNELKTAQSAFLHRHSQYTIGRSMSTNGLKFYNGGGYAYDFDVNATAAETRQTITQELMAHAWIDGATRVILVELTLYNPGTNLVVPCTFRVEVHGSGHALSRMGYEAFRLDMYRTSVLRYGMVVTDGLFVIFCFVIFIGDMRQAIGPKDSINRETWWTNPFFWMSAFMCVASIGVTGLRIHNVITQQQHFDLSVIASRSGEPEDHFAQLHGVGQTLRVERSLTSFLAFCVWLRVFKYTRSVPVFGTIGRTIMRAFPAIALFICMSAVVFVGFAQSFYLAFYTSNEGFQTMGESLMSMIRFIAGNVDYAALQRSNTVLTPILYTLALFTLGFTWTSTLLAIVINAYYEEVSDEGVFAFDSTFRDFQLNKNPLVLKHKEYDAAGMAGTGNTRWALTPSKYNRFVVNSLQKFDQSEMTSMRMATYIEADDFEEYSGAVGQNDSNMKIILRCGPLRGIQRRQEIQAIYFPIDMDETRCRAWWAQHKHYLRVGDAFLRSLRTRAPDIFLHVPQAFATQVRAGTEAAVHQVMTAVPRSLGPNPLGGLIYSNGSRRTQDDSEGDGLGRNDSGATELRAAAGGGSATGTPSAEGGEGDTYGRWPFGRSLFGSRSASRNSSGRRAGPNRTVSDDIDGTPSSLRPPLSKQTSAASRGGTVRSELTANPEVDEGPGLAIGESLDANTAQAGTSGPGGRQPAYPLPTHASTSPPVSGQPAYPLHDIPEDGARSPTTATSSETGGSSRPLRRFGSSSEQGRLSLRMRESMSRLSAVLDSASSAESLFDRAPEANRPR